MCVIVVKLAFMGLKLIYLMYRRTGGREQSGKTIVDVNRGNSAGTLNILMGTIVFRCRPTNNISKYTH